MSMTFAFLFRTFLGDAFLAKKTVILIIYESKYTDFRFALFNISYNIFLLIL